MSVDHLPCLQAWSRELGGISYPLLSDFWPHGEVAQRYGVFRDEGHSERAIFLIDADGVIRYIDVHDIDDQPSNEVLFAEIARLGGTPARPADAPPPSAEHAPSGYPAAAEGELVMYCTRYCPDCRRARQWLEEQGIPYVEVDVDADRTARERAAGLNDGRLHTPTFERLGEVCVDFQPERLLELIGQAGR